MHRLLVVGLIIAAALVYVIFAFYVAKFCGFNDPPSE
jgi:hypothetical protein